MERREKSEGEEGVGRRIREKEKRGMKRVIQSVSR
jgi:hypothetical protein